MSDRAQGGSPSADGSGSPRWHSVVGSDQPPRRADVVVVGGGIVGLAAAYELAVRGLQVCVLDRGAAGAAQSTRSWGFIRQQGRSVEELPLMIEANRMWRELEARLECDIEWIQGGNLRLTDNADRVEDYGRWIEVARSFGLDSRVASPDEVGQILPGFTGRYLTAIFTPSDGQVNTVKVVAGYLGALRSLATQIYEHAQVTSIVTSGGRVAGVLTRDGFIAAPRVVLAAGVGSTALLRPLGLDVPAHFVGQTVALTTAVPRLTQACVWTGEIGFRQAPSGAIVLSSGGRGDVKFDLASLSTLASPRQMSQAVPMFWKNREYLRVRPREVVGAVRHRHDGGLFADTPSYADVDHSLAVLARYFPQLTCDVAVAWAGTIDGTPDALPIIEAVDRPSGLVVATGMSGHGFGIAPSVGKVVADLVTGTHTDHDLRPFRLKRFREGEAKAPAHLL
ncbi:MAG: FAD-binding oxidoreductase [Dermatophilaceae bacterium]